MPTSTSSLPEATKPARAPAEIVGAGLCIGCGGCAALEPRARMDWDRDGQLVPASPPDWMVRRDPRVARICPFSPEAANEDAIAARLFPQAANADVMIGRYEAAYVGHVAEGAFRTQGSSGGMVSWVAAELLRRGLVDGVAHVAPQRRAATDGRLFGYRISRDVAELGAGAKSRYYPIEMSDVLREIEAVPGRYAVVGVPCFIKAVNLLRQDRPVLADRIAFTLGLFCGHMKSARMADSFAVQLGVEPEAVQAIDYRLKNPERPANWYTAHLTLQDGSTRQRDWWHLVEGDWGSGFFMNSACNFCDDVTAETADVAVGDAWLEPYSSDGRGTNVVVVRSPLVAGLVEEAIGEGRLALEPVDRDFVRRTQAAGLRQRREGLAYRLARTRLPLPVRKRVTPSRAIPGRRKLIYRMRIAISAWSHRLFRLAQAVGLPGLYFSWGRAAKATYHGLAYSTGWLGRLTERALDPKGAARD
jgi:coenzyme F420-reducing hydrogenase beta subunit